MCSISLLKIQSSLKEVIAKTSELWLYLINSCMAKQLSLMDLSMITAMDFLGPDCWGFSSLWDVKKLQLDEALVKHNDSSFVWYCFGSAKVLKVTIQHVLSLVLQRQWFTNDTWISASCYSQVSPEQLFLHRVDCGLIKFCIITTFILCSCRLLQFTIYLPGSLQYCSNQPEQLS